MVGDFFDGDERCARLLYVHHGFDDKKINTARKKAPHLLFEDIDRLFKHQVAERLYKMSCRADVTGNQSPAS